MNDSQTTNDPPLAAPTGSALMARWREIAIRLEINVDDYLGEGKYKLSECVRLGLEETHDIRGQQRWIATMDDSPEGGTDNWLHACPVSVSAKNPFTAIQKCVSATLRDLSASNACDDEDRILSRRLGVALRKAWRYMRNAKVSQPADDRE